MIVANSPIVIINKVVHLLKRAEKENISYAELIRQLELTSKICRNCETKTEKLTYKE